MSIYYCLSLQSSYIFQDIFSYNVEQARGDTHNVSQLLESVIAEFIICV